MVGPRAHPARDQTEEAAAFRLQKVFHKAANFCSGLAAQQEEAVANGAVLVVRVRERVPPPPRHQELSFVLSVLPHMLKPEIIGKAVSGRQTADNFGKLKPSAS